MFSCIVWIAIYSWFDTPDFYDEIGILFGTVDFWGVVVLSVVMAIGMSSCPLLLQLGFDWEFQLLVTLRKHGLRFILLSTRISFGKYG